MSLPNHPSLLLLPPPPKPAKPPAFHAAYYPPLKAALTSLANLKLPAITILDIAFPIASADIRVDVLENFYEIEKLLSSIYSLACIICAHESIETEGPGGVDARVILLYDQVVQDEHSQKSTSTDMKAIGGPVIDYPTLAISRRKWRYIFTVDGEVGQGCAARYLKLAKRITPPLEGEVQQICGGLSMVSSTNARKTSMTSPKSREIKHNTVAVGGTFDHLHAGHKLLLTATAMLLQHSTSADIGDVTRKRLIVGITGDELLKNKKYREYLASWEERARDVTEFLKSVLLFVTPGHEEEHTSTQLLGSSELSSNTCRAVNTLLKPNNIIIECVEIRDPFGPTVTDETITGLAVSGETRSGGKAINDKRAEHGWHRLEVFEIAVLDAEEVPDDTGKSVGKQDFASKISSSEIRKRKAERAKRCSGPSL